MDGRIVQALDDLKRAGFLLGWGGDWNGLKETSRLCSDSRLVKPGDVFACVCGRHFDGHSFIMEGLRLGVAGFMIERPTDGLDNWIQVTDVRAAMGFLAARLAGSPCDRLKMVAVTGTNGKSTSSYMIRSVLSACGIKTGLIGTVVYHDGDKETVADRTTPESTALQRLYESMIANGCGACVMECSSHGLVQGRISGSTYDGALFTNLSPEHLDYHGTMEEYFAAKSLLFTEHLKPNAVISVNGCDPWGQKLAARFPLSLTWGLGDGADVRVKADRLTMKAGGSDFDLQVDGQFLGRVALPMTGRFNVENALGAASLCIGLGCSPEAVVKGLETMPQVPGRMERINLSNGVTVIVDFAHTEIALTNLLATLRPLAKRLISVFGHGGERFAGARPELGKIAGQTADRVIVTMDNPRNEDPAEIARAIVAGLEGGKASFSTVLSRRDAVFAALDEAERGDVVVISGKGAEPYLEIKGVKYPYSDRDVVGEWSASRGVGQC
ncbi:UDP-N-acetylmuramoyl-L-alanyl-D-glutamate--2,6-diaminopimelate ligase [Jonquetella sp. BV3C21]|uniref:UDP-N-acetylmuramoyl-L-alanyl-D-glutamate--2, 6-diaminopimelate ligase n=1 Tax=Jonquetella sp. BV3C21 TaxID=1111126 RepID=UPI0003AE0BB3|nr:UDP-N-acetylmuramoyl-L-alanyl-D-glutamate--2,6-diaminopimelate ligase [Jonquetella sp. BV3C21]ERL24485.1 UDP-N-acetylmuramoyl-L-alanyl-D-glutamate--2,6-diaminopimelate ligase [Jonquetella sp. BV3C21]